MDTRLVQFRRRLRKEFHRLVDLSFEERRMGVAEIEREDAELAAGLCRLLSLADADMEADGVPGDTQGAHPGDVICGRFRLLRRLGIGGMGEVFLAERTNDVQQQVALKLVRSDLPVPVTRAYRERQILARLNHPHIAGLIDAGLTSTGQPWFAMEYVDGRPITHWCDEHALDIVARARLFALVCRAVQFAHRNLVMHRDIKPSNILIDGDGVPKLLDFGIAKVLDATDPQQTQTLALTPAYAAPEQLRGESVTTASDVYQLGLVMYELLCGVSAHAARRGVAGLPRMDQVIAEWCDRGQIENLAARRQTKSHRLRRLLGGDLGRIVAKATAQDVLERYETAQAMADDIDRWIQGLPVAAHRGHLGYRIRKLIRRHAIATMLVVCSVLGLVGTSIIALNSAYSERVQREHAEQQHLRSDKLLEFMRSIFQQAEPANADGVDLSASELLDRAAARLHAQGGFDPVTRAMLTKQIADTYLWIGQADKSLVLARASRVSLDPERDTHATEYLGSVVSVLNALYVTGNFQELVDTASEVLPLAARTVADSRSWRATMLKYRSSGNCRLLRHAACEADLRDAIRELESDPEAQRELAQLLNNLAALMDSRGDARQALALFRRADALNRAVPNPAEGGTIILQYNIAKELFNLGRIDEAIGAVEPLLERFEIVGGPDREIGLASMRRLLAKCYAMRGDYRRALSTIEAVITATQALAGSRDIATDLAIAQLARGKLALDLDDFPAALHYAEEAGDAFALPRRPSIWAIRAVWLFGEVLLQLDRCEEAGDWFDRAERRAQQLTAGKPSWILAEIEDSRGRCAIARRNPGAAKTHFGRAVSQFSAALGQEAASTIRSRIHRRWAQVLAADDGSQLAHMEEERNALATVLGGEDRPAVRDADALIDELSTRFGKTNHAGTVNIERAGSDSRPAVWRHFGVRSLL